MSNLESRKEALLQTGGSVAMGHEMSPKEQAMSVLISRVVSGAQLFMIITIGLWAAYLLWQATT